jgi:hypothetical protein
VLIPLLQKELAMFDHECSHSFQFMAPKALRHRQIDRTQPVLRDPVAMLDVNMRRLSAFSAEEEKPEA